MPSITAISHHFIVRKLPFTLRGKIGSRAAYSVSCGELSEDVTKKSPVILFGLRMGMTGARGAFLDLHQKGDFQYMKTA
ncbi:hypothetical protein GALL_445100 [mine drainage metagenome]|uniref:Uncharacterized protein n=1 Tax=mine drainage metagenome TaxID=410659 RepID=A0A1J5PSQ5_9ZZZZ